MAAHVWRTLATAAVVALLVYASLRCRDHQLRCPGGHRQVVGERVVCVGAAPVLFDRWRSW